MLWSKYPRGQGVVFSKGAASWHRGLQPSERVAMNRIMDVGITLSCDKDHEGYYAVSSWVRTEHLGYVSTLRTDHLSWTEAVDVMLVLTDENKPGDDLEGESRQGTIW